MKVDLVFEGGGVLGISFVGAYKALEDFGFKVGRAAGTSAGSIISALIIAGYKPNELIDLLKHTSFKQFMEKTKLSKTFLIGKLLSLIFNKGIYSSNCVEKWIEELLAKKGIKTFGDIMINGESPLKVIGADITNRKLVIFPDDLAFYNLHPHDYPIAKAVRISCTIPYYYTPVRIIKGDVSCYLVDGGLLSIFPIWIFDTLDDKPKRPVIGLKIKDKDSLTSNGKENILAFTEDIINACINKDEMPYVCNKDRTRTIIIENNQQIKATDFKLSEKDIKYLYDMGYKSCESYLKNWDYHDYIKLIIS